MILERFEGINNQNNTLDVGLTGLTAAKNVDIDRNGRLATRQGYTRISGISPVAISQNLVLTADNKLYRINSEGSVELIAQNIPGQLLTSVTIADCTYFSTNEYIGSLHGNVQRPAGVAYPDIEVDTGIGNLSAGRYLINATAVTEDGRESGCGSSIMVEVDDLSSILINVDVPVNHSANIYVSNRDGEQLYFISHSTGFVLSDDQQLTHLKEPCTRQFKGSIPTGTILEEHRGYLFSASGNYLYYSDPLDYEIYDYLENAISFGSEITLCISLETGLYISTLDEVFFLSGESPENWILRSVYDFGAKANTAIRINLDNLFENTSGGYAALFVSSEGFICVGLPDGSIQNLTNRKYKIDPTLTLNSTALNSQYLLSVT